MRVSAAARAALLLISFTVSAVVAEEWEKVLLTDAVKSGAKCLDGSPGGFYIRRRDPTKWIVFHQGGGWCGSDENCAQRANCSASPPGCIMGGKCCALGSSTVWGPTYTDKYEGSQIFSMPAFANHTAVYAMYCDGGSWTGNVSAPVRTASGATIYYRGRLLLDAMLDNLLDKQGMSRAAHLLYGGCSAGGLTAYLHADYVASRMPAQTRTLAIADAMFSLDSDSYAGVNLFPKNMEWGYGAWKSAGSVNAACEAHYEAAGGGGGGWQCMFGANAAPFIKTPLFVLNSKYDTWQEKAIIGAPGSITKCPPNVTQFWVAYGNEMVARLDALPAQHGAFLSNCPAHCQTGTAAAWGGTTVDGTAMGAAFLEWWTAHALGGGGGGGSGGGNFRWIERGDVTPHAPNKCG